MSKVWHGSQDSKIQSLAFFGWTSASRLKKNTKRWELLLHVESQHPAHAATTRSFICSVWNMTKAPHTWRMAGWTRKWQSWNNGYIHGNKDGDWLLIRNTIGSTWYYHIGSLKDDLFSSWLLVRDLSRLEGWPSVTCLTFMVFQILGGLPVGSQLGKW